MQSSAARAELPATVVRATHVRKLVKTADTNVVVRFAIRPSSAIRPMWPRFCPHVLRDNSGHNGSQFRTAHGYIRARIGYLDCVERRMRSCECAVLVHQIRSAKLHIRQAVWRFTVEELRRLSQTRPFKVSTAPPLWSTWRSAVSPCRLA